MHGDLDVVSWLSAGSVVSLGVVEFRDDAELESEIEAIVGALEPMEESDAIEVDLETNQDGHDTGKAQPRAEGARSPTLEQYVKSREW